MFRSNQLNLTRPLTLQAGWADDGKRLGHVGSSDGRCIEKGLPRGGVWGGERAGFGRMGRLADDGKRLDSLSPTMDVPFRAGGPSY